MDKQTTWVLDPAHSELTFKVKHLMISNVKGSFKAFEAIINTNGEDFGTGTTEATIDVASVTTGSDDRDGHLRSADFFDADQFKTIAFNSTELNRYDEENGQLKGKLTIKGVTRDVAFDIEFGGVNKDPWGNIKAGFTLTGKINRGDFGLNWNAALETGGVLVSDEVKVHADLQFLKKA
jgi:polyisoprenoid-binding protein YceI